MRDYRLTIQKIAKDRSLKGAEETKEQVQKRCRLREEVAEYREETKGEVDWPKGGVTYTLRCLLSCKILTLQTLHLSRATL
jgi:hypothetical protein